MKMTLLEIVQNILSDMDAEEVNSIADTTEATQVASIVKDTFNNMVANRTVPEHKELVKLTSLGDISRPTHMKYGEDVTKLEKVWYDTSADGSFTYSTIRWCAPEDFITRADGLQTNYVEVMEGGTMLRVGNAAMPTFYTSFDDEHLIFNSYDASVDATITEGRSRAYGTRLPTFDMTDDNFVADIDAHMFPYLLAEAKSTAFSLLKGGPDPKVEQAARRQKSNLQNDKFNTIRTRGLSHYGR